ncbi:MAG: glycine cleavage system protein H [Planctomycetaceae bacterium]
MSDPLTFHMGKYEARIPTDRRYVENHLWLQEIDGRPGAYRVGFTAYSIRLLQDVYFLDWSIDAETPVAKKQKIGEIESSKALSDLYVPAAGTVLAFNDAVLSDPSAINVDGYGDGWLYEFATDAALLDAAAYVKHLDAGWEKDQRYLKGQVNREG